MHSCTLGWKQGQFGERMGDHVASVLNIKLGVFKVQQSLHPSGCIPACQFQCPWPIFKVKGEGGNNEGYIFPFWKWVGWYDLLVLFLSFFFFLLLLLLFGSLIIQLRWRPTAVWGQHAVAESFRSWRPEVLQWGRWWARSTALWWLCKSRCSWNRWNCNGVCVVEAQASVQMMSTALWWLCKNHCSWNRWNWNGICVVEAQASVQMVSTALRWLCKNHCSWNGWNWNGICVVDAQASVQTMSQHMELMRKVETVNLLQESNKMLREENTRMQSLQQEMEAKVSGCGSVCVCACTQLFVLPDYGEVCVCVWRGGLGGGEKKLIGF